MRARLPVLISLCVSLFSLSTACSDPIRPNAQVIETPPTAAQSVVLTPSEATLPAGTHLALTATSTNQSGQSVVLPVNWSTSDPKVATVSDSGTVMAIAPGTAVITANAKGAFATAAVTIVPPAAAESVTVSPQKANVSVGQSAQFSAVVGGRTLSQGVVWSSSNTAVATVSSAGLVTGVAAGIASIRAMYNGQTSTAAVTVLVAPPSTPPASETPSTDSTSTDSTSSSDGSSTGSGVLWANRPSGFTLLTDTPWSPLTPAGWAINNRGGHASIITDATAPVSPTNVLEMRYPIGFSGDGVAPATEYYIFHGSPRELYIGFYWKPSNPWQGHPSNINKILFVMFADGRNITLKMDGPPGGPYYLRCTLEGDATTNYNAQNKIAVKLGVWHKVELYVKMDSYYGAGDGIARWWMDGQRIGSYTNLRYPNFSGFEEFQFSPTWGGRSTVSKTENDYFRFDHIVIARK